ncbi:MAG TPA: 50S ribosomal protein L25 [Thermoanaerobaculia bacterium]|jgi:large subunit ribosomal protein L25|nr:50S ribosomal protein L25 [Thermoanaerobaculia bacterium]
MSELTIDVQKREKTGKGANRRARSGGMIPAVVYGGGKDSISIQIDRKSMLDLMKKAGSENPIYLLKLTDSGGERHAMIREVQTDPISRQVLHIDFQRVMMDQKVRVQVPVELTGVAYGVKTQGAVLDFVTREVHVECLPGDIPKAIELDVTGLHAGQHAEARDLKLPSGVTLLDEADRVICSVTHAKTEEVEGAADRPEPELIKKGKTEEA